jgi:hypothetical protein
MNAPPLRNRQINVARENGAMNRTGGGGNPSFSLLLFIRIE